MKKTFVIALLLMVIALAAMAGCGQGEQQTEEPEGQKITVEEAGEGGQGGKVVVEGEEGETSYEVGAEKVPSEEELGAPIYPGAEYVPGSGMPVKVSTETGEIDAIKAEFTTRKAINKVITWYEDELGGPTLIDEGETSWVYRNDNDEVISVAVKAEGDLVRISIGKMAWDLESGQ